MTFTTTYERIGAGDACVVTFSGLTTGDVSPVIDMSAYVQDHSILSGTLGGATVSVKAMNSSSDWQQWYTASVGTYSYHVAIPRYMRVEVTGGSGVELTFSVLLIKQFPSRV